MLHKDQYDQAKYNDYYKQARAGSEIKDYTRDDDSSFMKKALLLFGLILLGVIGYFGFKLYSTATTTGKIVIKEEPLPIPIQEKAPQNETIEDKVIKTIAINQEKTLLEINNEQHKQENLKPVTEKNMIQKEIINQVQEKQEERQTNQKISTEDISKIVELVMNKIDTEKRNNDNELLTELEHSDKDSIKTESTQNNVSIDNLETSIHNKVKQVDTYNKVTLENSPKKSSKELTELSEQITKLLHMNQTKGSISEESTLKTTQERIDMNSEIENDVTSNYKNSITKEIQIRSNAMRIIVVKEGDTLNKIAQRAYGKASSYQKIYDANPDILNRPDRIYVGQKLHIPK